MFLGKKGGGFTLASSTKCKNAYVVNINAATCESLAPRMGNRPPIAGEVKVALLYPSLLYPSLRASGVRACVSSVSLFFFFFSSVLVWTTGNLTPATDGTINCQPARHRLITEDREVLVAHQGACEVAKWKCDCWTTSSASHHILRATYKRKDMAPYN